MLQCAQKEWGAGQINKDVNDAILKILKVLPANGGELGLLLHFLSKYLQLLLERFFVVVWVDVVIIWHHR